MTNIIRGDTVINLHNELESRNKIRSILVEMGFTMLDGKDLKSNMLEQKIFFYIVDLQLEELSK